MHLQKCVKLLSRASLRSHEIKLIVVGSSEALLKNRLSPPSRSTSTSSLLTGLQFTRYFSSNRAAMVKARKFVLAKHFENVPKETDLQLMEEDVPSPKVGQLLVEAVYLSVDPYMRAYAYSSRLKLGSTMIGLQVARIIESKNDSYPVGKYIVGGFGWRSHTLVTRDMLDPTDQQSKPYILPDLGELPASLGVGMLGMTGNTAYFGFLEICAPKAGETVVITGAAGAVGSHVGQIAKIKGCKVIGLAGTGEKCEWLKTLGFDKVINYKSANLHSAIGEAAPNGIDCYFDNVGGEISSIVMQHMNEFGRVSVCGSISCYNNDIKNMPKATILQPIIVFRQLTVKGFIVSFWQNRWMEGISQNLKWIKEGKLKYRETVTEGFENMPKAFIGMLAGDNFGKAVVKA